MRRRALLVFLGLSLAGCGRTDKVDAKTKFESVRVGQVELDLRKALGDPRAIILRDLREDISHTDMRTGRTTKLTDAESYAKADRTSWPVEAKLLPRREIESKVFVYESGNLRAFYFIDESHTITFVSVHAG